MNGRIVRQIMGLGVLTVGLWAVPQALAQKTSVAAPALVQTLVEQPDASRVKQEFKDLLERYPPTLRHVFREDPTLLTQQSYLAPYPALAAYLSQHPEIPLNPAYYVPGFGENNWDQPQDRASRALDMWRNFLQGIVVFAGFAMAIGLLTWLIRTFIDYRRWNRLSKVQAEVHTRLLDRFGTNEELMAYISTPAGSKFLQSAPISLDTGTRSMNAPLSRIMLSLQAGLVLAAAGIGFMIASQSIVDREAADPLHIMGILGVALGAGFAVSAGASYLISMKLGLFDQNTQRRSFDPPEAQ